MKGVDDRDGKGRGKVREKDCPLLDSVLDYLPMYEHVPVFL